MKTYLLLLILCIGVSLTGCQEKFEYKVEYFMDSSLEEALNELGSEGWQIVAFRRATSSGRYGYELILMRDVGESEKSAPAPAPYEFVAPYEKLNEDANKNE